MRMRLIYVFLLTLALAMPAGAQSLFAGGQQRRVEFNQQQSLQRVKQGQRTRTAAATPSGKRRAERPDTALYVALTKRFGWYYGIGQRLTKSEACRLPCYYRLTDKDSQGRFTHIEAVNGSGHLTTAHDMSNYLISRGNAARRQVAYKWQELLQTVVQWQLWPSGDGKHLGMESGYDEQGNLIYSLILVPLDGDVVMAHYTDGFGEPVSLLTGENSPRYVQITQDQAGYDRQIIYLNDDGDNKRNLDGAYMLRQDYDTAGNVVRALSCLPNGTPVKDDWGNCGWTATYNDWGQMLSNTSIDERMQPVRPKRRFLGSVDVVSTRFEYDRHRRVGEYYLNEKGEKDVTSAGVHSRRWSYDAHGNVSAVMTCDTAGRLTGDYNGVAQTIRTYDKAGKVLSVTALDKDSLYANFNNSDDLDGACMMIEGQGMWRTTTGRDTVPIVRTFVQGNTTTTIHYKDGVIIQMRVDDRGRPVKRASYTLDWQPQDIEDCCLTTCSYRKQGNQQIEELTTYSLNQGTPAGPDTIRTMTVTDTAEHTRLVQTFRGDTLLSSYGQTLDNDLQSVTGQFGYDALGHRARSHLEDALYYRVKSGTTYRGETAYMMGRNEYDEPSYVVKSEASNSAIYCTRIYDAISYMLLDEDNRVIDNVKALRDSLPKGYCVEVLTRRAYDLGLRSGDVIVRYNDFYYPQTSADNWHIRSMLQVETYLTRNSSKRVLVWRFDHDLKKHRMHEIVLPAGTPGELGFLIQTVYYTRKEAKRYDEAVTAYLRDKGIDADGFVTDKAHYGDKTVCLIRPYKVSTATMPSWRQGLQDDVVVLGADTHGEKYVAMSSVDDLIDVLGEDDEQTIYYTANGRDVQSVALSRNGAVTVDMYFIPKEEYQQLLKLEEGVSASLRQSASAQDNALSPDQAFSYIAANTTSVKCVRLKRGDKELEDLLNETITAFKSEDIEAIDIVMSEDESLWTPEDVQTTNQVLRHIDFTGFEKWSDDDDEMDVYFRRESNQVVFYKPTFLMIMTLAKKAE